MDNKKKYPLIVISVMLIFMILLVIVKATQFAQIPATNLNATITCQMTRNHKTHTYTLDRLPLGKCGDRLQFNIPIPKHSKKMALCFYQKHSIVEVDLGKKRLYSYGEKQYRHHQMIGDQLFMIALLPSAKGKTVTVHVKHVEKDNSSHFTQFRLLKVAQANLYPLVGNEFVTIIFMFTTMLGVALMGLSLIGGMLSLQEMFSTALLGGLVFFSSAWQLASKRILYIFLQNHTVCAQTEYFAFYIGIFLMFLYLYSIHHNRMIRRMYLAMAALFVLFISCLMIYTQVTESVIVDYELLIYIISGILCLIAMIVVGIHHHKEKRLHIYSDTLMVSVFLLITHVSLRMRDSVLPGNIHYANKAGINFSSVALILFIIAVVSESLDKFMTLMISQAQNKQLEQFAFIDSLTHIPNRQYCQSRLSQLAGDYVIIFLDVDYLKAANDQYGHEMGDRLLKCVAKMIYEIVQDKGFCSRFGGDEFVIVLTHQKDISYVVTRIHEKIREVNLMHRFPFNISVSYGIASHHEGQSPEDVCKKADRAMYQYKKKHHRAR